MADIRDFWYPYLDPRTGKVVFRAIPKSACKDCTCELGRPTTGRIVRVWLSAKYLYVTRKCPRCGREYQANYRYRSAKGDEYCPNCNQQGIVVKGRLCKRKPTRFKLKCPRCSKEWEIKVDIYEYEMM